MSQQEGERLGMKKQMRVQQQMLSEAEALCSAIEEAIDNSRDKNLTHGDCCEAELVQYLALEGIKFLATYLPADLRPVRTNPASYAEGEL